MYSLHRILNRARVTTAVYLSRLSFVGGRTHDGTGRAPTRPGVKVQGRLSSAKAPSAPYDVFFDKDFIASSFSRMLIYTASERQTL